MAEQVLDRDFFVQQGKKGAAITNGKLTKKQRQKSARRAAKARWKKAKEKTTS